MSKFMGNELELVRERVRLLERELKKDSIEMDKLLLDGGNEQELKLSRERVRLLVRELARENNKLT